MALVRVVVYHSFSWVWLPLVFPSMPTMFALAGALVASSLDRSGVNPWPVLGRRIRRLLPPAWALGLVAVPVMLIVGWTSDVDRGLGSPLSWDSLLLWVIPVAEPPGSQWGLSWSEPLWYLATYLWLLMLSPSLLWLFRRWPLRTLAAPIIIVALEAAGVWSAEARGGQVLSDVAEFAACWMLGFAHYDNKIRPIPLRKILPVALCLLVGGLTWLVYAPHPTPYLDEVPLAQALWERARSFSCCASTPTSPGWRGFRGWTRLFLSSCGAITIYLWGGPAILLTASLIALVPLSQRIDENVVAGPLQFLVVTFSLIILSQFSCSDG